MGVKIQLLESAKVYDINNLKSNPITELEAGTEIEVENVLKAWKAWYKLTLPDGRVGLISVLTKAQSLGYVALKAGGWPNFVKVLGHVNPQQFGYDIMECVKEYERDIVKHIQTDKNPEAVILGCSRAGADWLLEEAVINDNVVDLLTKKARKPDISAIQTLVIIERVQKRQLISDGIIKLLIGKARVTDTCNMETYTGFLVDIACVRQSNQIVDDIIDIYRASKYEYITYGGFRGLHKITKDDRIVDFLIAQLDQGFRVYDKFSPDLSVADLFVTKYRWGPAYYAAEELLAIGEERGIHEIVPRLLEFLVYKNPETVGKILGSDTELVDWCVRNRNTLNPYLHDGLNHKDEKIRARAEYILNKS